MRLSRRMDMETNAQVPLVAVENLDSPPARPSQNDHRLLDILTKPHVCRGQNCEPVRDALFCFKIPVMSAKTALKACNHADSCLIRIDPEDYTKQ